MLLGDQFLLLAVALGRDLLLHSSAARERHFSKRHLLSRKDLLLNPELPADLTLNGYAA